MFLFLEDLENYAVPEGPDQWAQQGMLDLRAQRDPYEGPIDSTGARLNQ